MREELSQHIANLLYANNRLNIPGLGSFELTHAPALVDQVQGQVSPPAKAVRFNDNLVMDDGILTNYLMARRGWTLTQAKAWLEQEVATIKGALDRREIVEFPGVGRFFRNFEQQLQFVAENRNFNTDSYGLHPVAITAVARSAAEKSAVVPPPKPTIRPAAPPTPSPAASVTSWLAQYRWWFAGLAGLLVLVVAALTFWPTGEAPNDNLTEVPRERLNASPSRDLADADPPTDSPATSGQARPDVPPPSAPEPTDTEAPTLAPEEHSAVIAVGLFGNPDNVQKLLAQLAQEGYSPVSTKEGRNTRVGVSVRYDTEAELQKTLNELRRSHAKNAFILERDGKRVKK